MLTSSFCSFNMPLAEAKLLMVRVRAERKTGKVRAAVDSVDGVGKGENVFAVGVVVLQGISISRLPRLPSM